MKKIILLVSILSDVENLWSFDFYTSNVIRHNIAQDVVIEKKKGKI